MSKAAIHKQGHPAIENGSIKGSNRTHVGLKSQVLLLNKHSSAFTPPASLLSLPFAKQGELVMSWLVGLFSLYAVCMHACLKVHIPTNTCAHTSLLTVPKVPSD